MKNFGCDFVMICLVAGVILFWGLGAAPLFDPDEPVYMQTAMEMLETQDFISPRIYGQFWYDKPPFFYWMVVMSIKLFGSNEFAARFPAAVSAFLGILGVYSMGKSFFSRSVGLVGALVLATSLEYFYLGKAAVTDSTLTCFFIGIMLFYLKRKYFTMYICIGLAVLTKGPVGIILPGSILLLHFLYVRDLHDVMKLKLLRGIGVVLLVAAPWYLAMTLLHGADFIQTFLGYHNITRFLQAEHKSGLVWYYYFPVLAAGFFPWSMALPETLLTAWKRRNGPQGEVVSLLLIWLAVVFVFFSVSQTKLISYILPMYPPMALLTGWFWQEKNFLQSRLAAILFAVMSGGILAAFIGVSNKAFGMVVSGVWQIGAVLFFMNLLWLYFRRIRKSTQAFWGMIFGMMLFVVVFITGILPAAAKYASIQETAAVFTNLSDKTQIPVYVEKFYRPGFCYYTGISGVEFQGDLNQLFESEKTAYFLLKMGTYLALPDWKREQLEILYHQLDAVLIYKKK